MDRKSWVVKKKWGGNIRNRQTHREETEKRTKGWRGGDLETHKLWDRHTDQGSYSGGAHLKVS